MTPTEVPSAIARLKAAITPGLDPLGQGYTALVESLDVAVVLGELERLQETARWIPVAERLPEKEGKYLVCCPSLDPGNPPLMCVWFDPDYGWYSTEMWAKAVTHWMPLPEPPGSEGNVNPPKPSRGIQ